MNNLPQLEMLAKARQQELQHEAKTWREKHPEIEPSERFYASLMARVGEMLTEVGTQLQSRYDEGYRQAIETATMPQVQLAVDPCEGAESPC